MPQPSPIDTGNRLNVSVLGRFAEQHPVLVPAASLGGSVADLRVQRRAPDAVDRPGSFLFTRGRAVTESLSATASCARTADLQLSNDL